MRFEKLFRMKDDAEELCVCASGAEAEAEAVPAPAVPAATPANPAAR